MAAAVRPLFWISASLLVWTQALYAPALAAVRRAKGSPPPAPRGEPRSWPRVSLIVAAYREEAVIAAKVANARALDYPDLEIIVAVDGGGDATAERAREAGAHRVLLLERGGKIRAQDAGVRVAAGEIVAFSDANALWDPDALRALVAPFADPGVGYACGQVRFTNEAGTNQEGLYWRYELWLREQESALASVTGGNGAIYAVRKEAYVEVDPIMGHDLSFPFRMVKNGRRAVYEPRARADREDGPLDRGRVGAQAAHDVARLADRAQGRPARPARLPAAVRADDRQPPAAALRHAAAARPARPLHARAAAPRARLPARGRRPGRRCSARRSRR